jgi:pentatricopeptide repeat protein
MCILQLLIIICREVKSTVRQKYEYLHADEGFFSPSKYNEMLKTLCGGGQVEKALDFFHHMIDSGVKPNETTFIILLRYTKKMNDVCMKIFEGLKQHNIQPTTKLYNIAIYSSRSVKNASQALFLRDQMIGQGVPMDVHTYNGLIGALFAAGRYCEGIDLFAEMKRCGIPPTTHTYTQLFSERDNLVRKEELLREMDSNHILLNIRICNILLNCYGRNFDVPGMRSVFARMLSSGIEPSINMFVSLLRDMDKLAVVFIETNSL